MLEIERDPVFNNEDRHDLTRPEVRQRTMAKVYFFLSPPPFFSLSLPNMLYRSPALFPTFLPTANLSRVCVSTFSALSTPAL